jgi:peptidoglycan L-alanyl-D-glutamate endopeptidase CwlK
MHDKLTIERIKTAHPLIREELERYYLEVNNKLPKGVRLRFSHVHRTNEEQDELFAKRPKVTNAKGGQSIHNYGLAFDIVILFDKDGNGTFETASWKQDEYFQLVVDYFKSKGYTWGGDFNSFKDNPHFQKDFRYTWRELIKMEKFTDKNGITYPKIEI